MTVGLIAKTALFPLHLWLPPAHAGAPAAGSALLSALVVKGSFVLIVRLWFDALPGLLGPGGGADARGAGRGGDRVRQRAGAAAGAAEAADRLFDDRADRLPVLSLPACRAPLSVHRPRPQVWNGVAWTGGVLQLVSHAVAKAAMFMAAGLIAEALGHDRIAGFGGIGRALPMTVFAFGLGGMSLMGLPPSGGFVAKAMLLTAAVGEGQWWWAVVILRRRSARRRIRVPGAHAGTGCGGRTVGTAGLGGPRTPARGAGAVDLRTVAGPCTAAAFLAAGGWAGMSPRRSVVAMSAVATVLLAASLAVPLAMLLSCLSSRIRARMPSLLAIAPVPALLAALLARGAALALPQVMLGLQFALDTPGALLLGVAALLWTAGGLYASTWLRGIPDAGRFAVWWLLTLTGSIGVFIATDLVSFYLVFSMVSLAAYGLIIDDGTPSARRNGLIYVALALLGEAFLLMAFVMLAQAVPNHSLLIRDAVAALPVSPWRTATLTLLLLGFGAKIGIVPFHVWMPLAYRSAPIPAAAVLSGAAVKAGVIGFIQFLPLHAALPAWGEALTAAGFLGLLRCRHRHHTVQSENGAGLFQHQPDGRHCRGTRHGTCRGR